MDSILEDMQCLRCHIEVAREQLHQMVMQRHLGMLEEDVVRLSQLLDDYILYYTRGQNYKCKGDDS